MNATSKYHGFVSISAENMVKLIEDNTVERVRVYLSDEKHRDIDTHDVSDEFFRIAQKVERESALVQHYRIILTDFSKRSSRQSSGGKDDGFTTEAHAYITVDYHHEYGFFPLKSHSPGGCGIGYVCALSGVENDLPLLKGLRESEDVLVRKHTERHAAK